MTSIDFLFEKLWNEPKDKFIWHSIFNKAMEIHKQEIINAYSTGRFDYENYTIGIITRVKQSNEYYDKCYVSKGSDDYISDISKMIEDDVDKFEKFLDKEIELGLSPKYTIERIKWYYKTYYKQPKKD
jgi:hypothetical protein